MPEFQLDTSGTIVIGHNSETGATRWKEWNDLDAFTQGYIEALFFTENEPSTTRDNHSAEDAYEGRISELPGDYGFSDLAPETLASIIADCADFQAAFREDLDEALDQGRIADYDDASAGRDFWFNRNGHGVGYWSRTQLDGGIGDKLSDACEAWHNVDAYLGDDGRVYLS